MKVYSFSATYLSYVFPYKGLTMLIQQQTVLELYPMLKFKFFQKMTSRFSTFLYTISNLNTE